MDAIANKLNQELWDNARRGLLGKVVDVRLNEYDRTPEQIHYPESVTLVFEDGKETTIHGGGDYCASSEIDIQIERDGRT